MKICTNLNIQKIIKTPLVRTLLSKSRPHHRHRPNRSHLEDTKRGRIKTRRHPDAMHGLMRKKLRCVKVRFTYKKIAPLVTRGRSANFRLRFYGTWRATKAPSNRMYDMANGKWKTVRPNVARFCRVHDNVMRRAHASRAVDEDYFATTLLDYEAEYEVPFTLRHYWKVSRKSSILMGSEVPKFDGKKKDTKRYKTYGSSSFNTESGDASINLNVDVGDDEEDEVEELA
ncbi:hypothetical protein Tco_1276772 [Tanacetum coccineum]